MYWFLVWFLDFSLKAEEIWAETRPGQCWPESWEARMDTDPDTISTHIFPLPLSLSFDPKSLQQPNFCDHWVRPNSCKSRVLWVHLHLKGLKGNSEHLLQCTVPPQSSLLPFHCKVSIQTMIIQEMHKVFQISWQSEERITSSLTFRAPLSIQHPKELYLQTPGRASSHGA